MLIRSRYASLDKGTPTRQQLLTDLDARVRRAQAEADKERQVIEMVPDAVFEGLSFIHPGGYYCDGSLKYEGRTLDQVVEHMTLLPPAPVTMAVGTYRSFAPTERTDDKFREVVNMVDQGPTQRAKLTDMAPFLVRIDAHTGSTVEWWSHLSTGFLFKIVVEVTPSLGHIPVTDWTGWGDCHRKPRAWGSPVTPALKHPRQYRFSGGGADSPPHFTLGWESPDLTWADVLTGK